MTGPRMEVREMLGLTDLESTEAIQLAVWGKGEKVDARDTLIAMQHEGALIAGGFVDGVLSAMLFGFPTREADAQHSHRLGVLESARGLGLGRKLKWFQRDWCLARGITRVRWTYDPLRIANARLNVGHLGAIVDRYCVDYYGAMVGINAGVASDRVLAEWQLDAPEVVVRSRGGSHTSHSAGADKRIAIPRDFAELILSEPAKAQAIRIAARATFLEAFADGWRITGFDAAACCYCLTKPRTGSGTRASTARIGTQNLTWPHRRWHWQPVAKPR